MLAFRHPLAGLQIPKGTVQAGEPVESAVLRELEEESGVRHGRLRAALGTIEHEGEVWHLHHVEADDLPDGWRYRPTGGGEESEHVFEFFWHPLSGDLGGFHPVFVRVIGVLRGRVCS